MDYNACRKSIARHKRRFERQFEQVNGRPRAILMDAYEHLLLHDRTAARWLSRHIEQFSLPSKRRLVVMAELPRCRLSGDEYAGESKPVENPGKLRARIAHLEELDSKISRAVALGLSDGFGALALQAEVQRKLRAARGLLGMLASTHTPRKGGKSDEPDVQGRTPARAKRARPAGEIVNDAVVTVL